VALSELYTWTTTRLAACFSGFMACLLARQEGPKRKTTKDDCYCRLWLAHNAPREKLLLTRETDPTSFDAVKNEHFLRNGSRTELRPEVYDKFAPFLRKQAKLTRKRTRSIDNWTGSLAHIGAMMSANPESSAYQKCGSVDSDIVTYVNRDRQRQQGEDGPEGSEGDAYSSSIAFHRFPLGASYVRGGRHRRAAALGAHGEGEGRGGRDGDRAGDDPAPYSAVCGRTPEGCCEAPGGQDIRRRGENLNGGQHT
jgi:hypothetical protein